MIFIETLCKVAWEGVEVTPSAKLLLGRRLIHCLQYHSVTKSLLILVYILLLIALFIKLDLKK